MKVAVISANGRSGKVFVSKALKAGYHIKAGVYGGTLAPADHLEVINCNATDQNQLENLLDGCDAVVSFIGHVKGAPANVQTNAIKNVVAVCEKLKIKRVVSLTGTGVRLPDDKPSFIDKLLNVMVTIVDPDRIKDGIMHAKALRDSDLDWTIVRVLKLQNTKPKPFVLKNSGPAKLITSREEVADAFIMALSDPNTIKQAPVICNP